jgi:hypothetical protein
LSCLKVIKFKSFSNQIIKNVPAKTRDPKSKAGASNQIVEMKNANTKTKAYETKPTRRTAVLVAKPTVLMIALNIRVSTILPKSKEPP